jgi:hypothetical protein
MTLSRLAEISRDPQAAFVLIARDGSDTVELLTGDVVDVELLADIPLTINGTPREVFSRAEELEAVGLDIPQVTRVALALRRRGMDINTAVYTVEELRDVLLKRKGGAAHA